MNATFVLVTPTGGYYNYEKNNVIQRVDSSSNGKLYTPFYSKELKYIHEHGCNWYDYSSPMVETKNNVTPTNA